MSDLLNGVRVLDFTGTVAGPYCTMILGDLGADVIKIERPKMGDELRNLVNYGDDSTNQQFYFFTHNRNKRSVTLDLKSEGDLCIALDLARKADVLVENMLPGAMARLGLDYEEIKKVNPPIIYCSLSGFGQYGPFSKIRAYDPIIQAESGLMDLTGHPDGPPTRCAAGVGDMVCALYGVVAILGALYKRKETGEGDYIDIAMCDSVLSLLTPYAAEYFARGKVEARLGNETTRRVPQNAYMASDGVYVQISSNDPVWIALCRVLGIDDLANDKRFANNNLRIRSRKILNERIAESFKKKPAEFWLTQFRREGIPCARVNSIEEVLESENTKIREMVLKTHHEIFGEIKVLGFPYKFLRQPVKLRFPPPALGEHTKEVLKELGLKRETLSTKNEEKG